MGTDSIELGFLSVFALITFFIFLIVNKYSQSFKDGVLLDEDFVKPQSFHSQPVSRSGGIACLISLFVFFFIYNLLFHEVLYQYLFIVSSLFLIGCFEDFKWKISPNFRLIMMIILLVIFINILQIKILNIDLVFLNFLLNNQLFSTIFILLCFLFVVNGANLIDGFNGLLTINVIIINSVLLYMNLSNDQLSFSFFLSAQLVILITFLLFNFPKAKMFLGDSGAYMMGSIIALNTIITNNLISNVSTFFFCTLLIYIFFEVFFSFFRKIFQKKSPLLPDGNHLHMIVFKILRKNKPDRDNNYLTSIFVNFGYLILILPGVYFMENALLSRSWFFILIIIYVLLYSTLYKKLNNDI